MRIYNYSPISGEYLNTSEARQDPLAGGWIIPAFATQTAPPATGLNQTACFRDGRWAVYEDNRGKVWDVSTREEISVLVIGPLPENLTAIPPANEYSVWDGNKWAVDTQRKLVDSQEKMVAEITAKEEQKNSRPIEITLTSKVSFKPSTAIRDMLELYEDVLPDAPYPGNNGCWDDKNGVPVPVTMGDLKKIKNAILLRSKENREVRRFHISEMMKISNPLTYDYSGGWK